MTRWKYTLASAVLMLGGMVGCKQQLYMTAEDMKAVTIKGLPSNLETDPNAVAISTFEGHQAPPTVDAPDRPPRYITLAEAIAIALEQGNRGSQAINFALTTNGPAVSTFSYSDDLVTFQGRTVGGDDMIRAFALDPAVVGADIEGALAKFDARLISSMTWQKVDTATANVLNNFNNGDTAQFSSGLFKPLPTGGVANITLNTNYTKLANPPTGFAVINPAYQPSLNFGFEQPLLRDYGIEMNQLLAAHPGSVVQNLRSSGGRAEGILVTRIRFEQQRNDFERSVNIMLINVETVYWALYASYFQLYAAEQGLRQAYITWQLTKSELDAGKKTAHELAQVRAQFANFRGQRFTALQNVLNVERQFRGLLNLPTQDGTRLVPADAPTLAPFKPDMNSSLIEALANRPELQMARHDVKANQLNVLLQANGARPDLRVIANYNVNSIGTSLNGSGTNNALANLADNKFNNWSVGLRLDAPIGFRDAHSLLRTANLALARSFVVLKNQEDKAARFLDGVNEQLYYYYRRIEAAQERRKALADQLRGLYARIQAGKEPLITVLTAQSDFATALQDEYNAIANYNVAIAGFQYAKGTIQQYNNVQIADGPLPNCALARATEHQRQRTEGIVARERAIVPTNDGPQPLPSLLEHQPPTPDMPAELQNAPLPAPTPVNPIVPNRPANGGNGLQTGTTPNYGQPLNLPAPSGSLPPAGRPAAIPVNRNGSNQP